VSEARRFTDAQIADAKAGLEKYLRSIGHYDGTLKKEGKRRLVGPCPQCDGDDRFSVKLDNPPTWYCRGCKKGGSAIDLLMHVTGCTFVEAVRRLANIPDPSPCEREQPQQGAQPPDNLADADRIWREVVHIEGTPGALHFYKRDIDLRLAPDFGGLRWHRGLGWIVGRFTDAVTGEPRGIWRRSIKKHEKARALGPMKGCVIRLWPDDWVSTGLVLGEGVETTLAAAIHVAHRGTLLQPAWAAASADNMRSFPVLPGIEALTILVDNDESGTGQDAAAECARRWLAAGREVIRLTPPTAGSDFTDWERP
jgi:phage/plasmid primase-like uncharacterized protein